MNFARIQGGILLGIFPIWNYAQNIGEKTIDTVAIISSTSKPTLIQRELIHEYSGSNLDILKNIPGVNLIQSGANTSKPVIDGLSGTRILTLHHGLPLINQNWADHHAPELDATVYPHIEIIKGARSVRYGAGALGGVVLLNSKPLDFNGKLNGSANLSGHSNDGKSITGITLRSAMKNKWAWQVQQTYHQAGDYKTGNYYVNNTGYRQLNSLILLGYKNKRFSGDLTLNRFFSQTGVFFGSLTGNIEEFQERTNIDRPERTTVFSYDVSPPKQEASHLTGKFHAKYNFHENNSLSFDYGYQQNHRKEFDVRRLDRSRIPTQHTHLSSHFLEALWDKKYTKKFNGSIGFQYQQQENRNIPGTGVVPTIPNYTLLNQAFFMTSEYKSNQWKAEIGVRYDLRSTNAIGYNFLGNRYGGKRKYSNLSYNALLEKQIAPKWKYTIDAGWAWRPPEPYEIYVNGKQHGIPIFYVGEENLQPERALKIVQKINYSKEKFKLRLSAFVQPIKGYIYSVPNGNYKYLFSGPAVIFQMVQTDAFFAGGDLALNYKITPSLAYSSDLAWIDARDSKSNGYLPMIPPLTFHQKWKWKFFSQHALPVYFTAEHRYTSKQKKYNPEQDLAPPPESYHLFDLGIASEFHYSKAKTCLVTIAVHNLFNKEYKNYTDHFRYFVHAKGMDIQLKTIINF
ncbi:TonB-dependent receptor [Bergeyella sp. RCAD1439]|uniref:TonB-dependent receptor n=1 Tax=Bergeyella anatis TaxID=3113737 RepID=UPI002E198EB8|nr:TonB-dependent receptor plug domain-containing protein [Bergeyella sp. RCAD1439]